jgi:hypothetical protein
LIQAKPFVAFEAESSTSPLPELSRRLLEEQKRSWPQLAAGYASLDQVRLREVRCRGFTVFLQFNPGRIASTGARVDDQSVRERPCFLCVENLPPLQKGILYKGEFLILCNPAPIFPQHFTISSVQHLPQALEPSMDSFLDLARDLSPKFTLFYNGPRCGASAPDHIHFQASPFGTIPVEKDALEGWRRVFRKKLDSVSVWTLKEYGRTVLVIESPDEERLVGFLVLLIGGLRKLTEVAEEPMMNILCSFDDPNWRIIFFPRRKHRPTVYFREGEDRVLISPAAVDMGGLIITPVQGDFERVDATLIEGMFQEVSLPAGQLETVVDAL